MILFLDFDGVLHPEYEREPLPADRAFCHLPRFEAIMRDFPDVEIVISSMWRHQFSLENLRSRFSPDIAGRITGTTLLHSAAGSREREIVEWLAARDRSDEPWVALDDSAWQFELHRDRLVACICYSGLDDEAESLLRLALAPQKNGDG